MEKEIALGLFTSSQDYDWKGRNDSPGNGWPCSASHAPNNASNPLDEYLPCHYFDYIVGTSTGGYIIKLHSLIILAGGYGLTHLTDCRR
jgi:hypothetical protein